MLKQLDRYILTQFFGKLFSTTAAFVTIFLVVDIIDHLDKFIDVSMPQEVIFRYYFHTLPWFISIGFPMAVLLSTVFTLSILQKNNELTAMKSSGIGIRRLAVPLLICGMIFSIISFIFDNQVVTRQYQKRMLLEEKHGLRKQTGKNLRKRDIYRQLGPNTIFSIQRFQFKNKIAHGISIQTISGQEILERFDAAKMVWDEKQNGWRVPRFTTRRWINNELAFTHSHKDTLLNIDITPLDLTRETGKPEEMNYWDLSDFVEKLVNNGIRDPRWAVNLHFKTAFACTSFLMVLFGLSLSIRKPRSNLAVGVGMSIGVIFLYYAALKFGQTMGYRGVLPPFISVWWANLTFLGIGGYLFFKTRT
jgi:LPS export ABC transporter permease LptG